VTLVQPALNILELMTPEINHKIVDMSANNLQLYVKSSFSS